MGRTCRTAISIALAAVASAIAPATSSGDGLPVPGGVDTTGRGVLSPDGAHRYLAISRREATVVERIDTADGSLLRSAWIDGSFAVPGVTVEGETAGLSHDGSALVLIRPRIGFPQRRTGMALLDPESLRVRRTIELEGDFSFDAISPDGDTAYLIEYPDPKDPTAYRLRALDLDSGQLVPGAILPQDDPGEEMRGFPLARATGLDGRWEYTLYDGGNIYRYGRGEPGTPFVHAIDTMAGRTLCIDLDWLAPGRLSRIDLELSADGGAVEVVDSRDGVTGTIDTATGEARQIVASAPASAESPAAGDDAGVSLLGIAVGLGALACGAGAVRLLRRRLPVPDLDD